MERLSQAERKALEANLPTCLGIDWGVAIETHARAKLDPTAVSIPRVYQLETTSLCNLSCVMCPRQSGMSRPKQIMDVELFETITKRDLVGTKAIELFGFGEPFTDLHISERISTLQNIGIKVVIATNGLLLDRVSDQTIKAIDYLVYDVDGVESVGYTAVRKGGNYDVMVQNLERVLSLREKYTVLQYINLDNDTIAQEKFLDMYSGRADEVRIKFFDTFAGQVAESPSQKNVCCLEVFYGVSIWSNGDVVMCDRDYDSIHKLGNVSNKPLLDIWHDKISNDIKSLHKAHNGEKLKLCSRCKEWQLTNLRNVPELTVNMFKGGYV